MFGFREAQDGVDGGDNQCRPTLAPFDGNPRHVVDGHQFIDAGPPRITGVAASGAAAIASPIAPDGDTTGLVGRDVGTGRA